MSINIAINVDKANKKELAKYFSEYGKKIIKVLAWSLTNIPRECITNETLVLLPKLESEYFVERANLCGYDPRNIHISYNMCNAINIKLFDKKISESLIFYDDNLCIVSKYLETQCGDFSPCKLIRKDDEEYINKQEYFQNLWNNSEIF